MFDLLAPLRKLATVIAFGLLFVAANAALLYTLSSLISSSAVIGTGGASEVLAKLRAIAGLFLPGNFWFCIQAMFLGEVMRRVYDYAVKVMSVGASAT